LAAALGTLFADAYVARDGTARPSLNARVELHAPRENGGEKGEERRSVSFADQPVTTKRGQERQRDYEVDDNVEQAPRRRPRTVTSDDESW